MPASEQNDLAGAGGCGLSDREEAVGVKAGGPSL
jgi:hypothetical protein